MFREGFIIQEIKRQMYLLGFPLVEENPTPRGPDLICCMPMPSGEKRVVAVIDIKNFTNKKTTTSNLISFVNQYQADYAGRTDGEISIWYKRVVDNNGEESLIRIADLPAVKWAGELIKIYPEEIIAQKLEWFREQISIKQSSGIPEPETAFRALLIVIKAKLAAEKEEQNRFLIEHKDSWETFLSKTKPLMPIKYFKEISKINKKNPDLPNLLLNFCLEIQPYDLSQFKDSLVPLLRGEMTKVIDKKRGFISTPVNVVVLIRKLLGIIIQPKQVVELGCGLGSLLSDLLDEWPQAIFMGCESDPWMAEQAELLINLVQQSNGEVLICDVIAPFSTLPEKLKAFARNTEIDVLVSHPPTGKPYSQESYKWFELAQSRVFNLEDLFLERALEIVRQGGLVCMIIPDGLLSGKGSQPVREFILRESWLNAVISLPQGTFVNSPGLKASIIVLRKKADKENQDEIFMAEFPTIEEFTDEDKVNSVVAKFEEWAKGGKTIG